MTLWQIWFFPSVLHEIVAVKRFCFNPSRKKISAQIARCCGLCKGCRIGAQGQDSTVLCVFGRLYYHSQVCTPCPWTLYFHLCHVISATLWKDLYWPPTDLSKSECAAADLHGDNVLSRQKLPAVLGAPASSCSCCTATWTSSTSLSSPSSNEE